ncbi:hypothetical protein [Deinococcus marmoris]|nr:hypothetical protein [Deinococcus marmoris]
MTRNNPPRPELALPPRMTFHLIAGEIPELDELLSLYASVDWTAYTRDPQALARALRHSSFMWAAR